MSTEGWLTKDDLKAAQALADAATPGPWVRRETLHGESRVAVQGFEFTRGIADVAADPADYGKSDAEFIAQARTLVPALLHRIRFQHDKAIRAQEFWESKIRGLERDVEQYRFMHSSRCAEVERANAAIARVQELADLWEMEAVEQEDRDIVTMIRAALEGGEQ